MSRKRYNRPQFEGFTVTAMGCEANLAMMDFTDSDEIVMSFWVETVEKGKAYVAQVGSGDALTEPAFTQVLARDMINCVVRFLGDELKAAGLRALRNGED